MKIYCSLLLGLLSFSGTISPGRVNGDDMPLHQFYRCKLCKKTITESLNEKCRKDHLQQYHYSIYSLSHDQEHRGVEDDYFIQLGGGQQKR